MKYPDLLKTILLKPNSCINTKHLPKTINEWQVLLDLLLRNRLVFLLFHFTFCNKCLKLIPNWVLKDIKSLYYIETLIRRKNYNNLKKKLKEFIRKTKTPLILLKDFENDKLVGYPPFYIPLKFDIDILGKYKDLSKLRQFLKKIGYKDKARPYGWPDKPIPQYKFEPYNKKPLCPQVEFRHQAITMFYFNKKLLEQKGVVNLTTDIWKKAKIKKGDFKKLPKEYLLLHLCLIYYFEDECKGLHNLYRIWLLINQEKDKLDWNLPVFLFVIELAQKIFSNGSLIPAQERYRVNKSGMTKGAKLALKLINLDYICRVYLPKEKNSFRAFQDRQLHILTKGLLAEETLFLKLLFFLHPKRLIFLLLGLSKII